MTKAERMDKSIEIVKTSIVKYALRGYDEENEQFIFQIDDEDIDCIAEEVAEEICRQIAFRDTQTAYNEGYEKGCRSKMAYDYVACAKKYAVNDFAEMLIEEFIKSAENQELSTVKGVLKNVCPAKVNKIKKRFLKE